jgi:hypothetical protein
MNVPGRKRCWLLSLLLVLAGQVRHGGEASICRQYQSADGAILLQPTASWWIPTLP